MSGPAAYAAIENDDDTLEQSLLNDGGSLQLHEAGLDVSLSLENEAGKISLLRLNSDLAGSYLVNLGIDASLLAAVLAKAVSVLRAEVTTKLIEQGVDAAFDQDFSPYHTSDRVDATFASARVIAATQETVTGQPGTASVNDPAASVWTLSSMTTGIANLRTTFSITAGNQVQFLNKHYQ